MTLKKENVVGGHPSVNNFHDEISFPKWILYCQKVDSQKFALTPRNDKTPSSSLPEDQITVYLKSMRLISEKLFGLVHVQFEPIIIPGVDGHISTYRAKDAS